MCMYEMCGTFAVCKIAPQVKLAFEQAYGSRWGDARLGWENVKDASGNPTDLWKRPPLIELSELTEFANKIQGLRGAKSFTRAAKCITGIVASPLEVQASMLFGLSRLRGGEGLRLTNNVEIRMTRSARLISGLDRRYADILLSNKDGSRECLVECQGKAIHGSMESKISDSDRTTALQAMGYPVVLMTYSQLADPDAFHVVMELIMSYLDMPLKDKTPRQQELERRLREEIFIDWAGMKSCRWKTVARARTLGAKRALISPWRGFGKCYPEQVISENGQSTFIWHIETDSYLLKPLIKLFIKAVVLSDLGLTVYYPKQLVLGSTFQAAGSNEIGPRFVKTGAEWTSWPVWQTWRRRYLITRTRYIDGICLSASMVLPSRCSSVSNMV